ncbi:cupredoxin domain-containing protein [Teichococcus wenyumeiae]|nr:copper-binding protein [Pseudoroseomonas wenyumeiae]
MAAGLAIACAGAWDSRPASARGDLATRAQRLEPLIMGSTEDDFTLSQREYRLETGRYYRWRIASAGRREYNLVAPEFWRNVWIRQVAVGKTEIKTGILEELDFDDVGEVEVFFVPVRTGNFTFRVRGLEERGMTGNLIVE